MAIMPSSLAGERGAAHRPDGDDVRSGWSLVRPAARR
jgi:hypothetical protein